MSSDRGRRVRRHGRAPTVRAALLGFVILTAAACGNSPSQPGPIQPTPTPTPTPAPVNVAPSIDSISVQGPANNQPPNFADLGESVTVAAVVRDAETPVDQLQYNWTATLGTFAGSGSRVTWSAPADAQTPAAVTLTLEVVERYGSSLEHRVSGTANLALHNSAREIGDMARQFLVDFSTTSLKDWRVVMRNFKESACPPSSEYADERTQVENHYTNFVMHSYSVLAATVNRNFGGSCFAGVRGDACASVPVTWDSTDIRSNDRRTTRGTDHLTAAYARADSRWWLCSSRFEGESTFGPGAGHPFYWLRR